MATILFNDYENKLLSLTEMRIKDIIKDSKDSDQILANMAHFMEAAFDLASSSYMFSEDGGQSEEDKTSKRELQTAIMNLIPKEYRSSIVLLMIGQKDEKTFDEITSYIEGKDKGSLSDILDSSLERIRGELKEKKKEVEKVIEEKEEEANTVKENDIPQPLTKESIEALYSNFKFIVDYINDQHSGMDERRIRRIKLAAVMDSFLTQLKVLAEVDGGSPIKEQTDYLIEKYLEYITYIKPEDLIEAKDIMMEMYDCDCEDCSEDDEERDSDIPEEVLDKIKDKAMEVIKDLEKSGVDESGEVVLDEENNITGRVIKLDISKLIKKGKGKKKD